MDYITAFLVVFVVIMAFLFFREILKHKRASITKQMQLQNKSSKNVNFDDLFATVPKALDEAEKLLAEQTDLVRLNKSDPSVLKPLESRVNQLKWVQNNEWWLRQFAPYLDSIGKNLLDWFR